MDPSSMMMMPQQQSMMMGGRGGYGVGGMMDNMMMMGGGAGGMMYNDPYGAGGFGSSMMPFHQPLYHQQNGALMDQMTSSHFNSYGAGGGYGANPYYDTMPMSMHGGGMGGYHPSSPMMSPYDMMMDQHSPYLHGGGGGAYGGAYGGASSMMMPYGAGAAGMMSGGAGMMPTSMMGGGPGYNGYPSSRYFG
ncbi:hypothetical protein BDA99DRAFT_493481 [Phascolomyces articulosus]|uniref:Uncharacterized protein n=1 Tax=Phascolomyces articulosus TaxID=60185 RepID=A0AAD5KD23_9FUNG|nr:hypothetical protein BDA99DRAFT_493481 [Phascolomyces articulosus]